MALKVLIASKRPSPTQASIILGREILVASDGSSNKQCAVFPLRQFLQQEDFSLGAMLFLKPLAAKDGWERCMLTHQVHSGVMDGGDFRGTEAVF